MLIQQIIQHLLDKITLQGCKPVVHFELEGVLTLSAGFTQLDYQGVNQELINLGIEGELKTEYWKNQWEYVSLFMGQSPLKEAQNLAKAMEILPQLMSKYGAAKVLMDPVAWGGDSGRYLSGSGTIFSLDTRSVHIPNAIQINVSVDNEHGENLFASPGLGECIQDELLINSYPCCLLFLPEEDAFKRLALREDYALDAELSSPVVLSGGHQGSIALYKKLGKHNQLMGQEPLFFAVDNSVLYYGGDWQKTARVEHRIGASSQHYDPYLNVMFILLNVLEGLAKWKQEKVLVEFEDKALPNSLYDQHNKLGAISLFKQNKWLEKKIDYYCSDMDYAGPSLGQVVKNTVVGKYQKSVVTVF
jgi:hypothetical protein